MNGCNQQLVASLRARIVGVDLADTSALVRALNGATEELRLTPAKSSILHHAILAGAIPTIKGVEGTADVEKQLAAVSAAFMEKGHLDRRAARYAIRIWAAALDVAPLSTKSQVALPKNGASAIHIRVGGYRILLAVVVAAAIPAVCLGIYYYREIGQKLAELLLGLIGLGCLYLVATFLRWLFAWPTRKFVEGVNQIKQALDWTPGWVYIVVIAILGIADWSNVLPYGVREVCGWANGPVVDSSSADFVAK